MNKLACAFTSLAPVLCLALFSCGGGGGGGGGGNASISGLITVPSSGGSILEAEPNGTVSQAHALGNIAAGQTLQVIGNVSPADSVDGFKIIAPSRVKVTATLTFDDTTGNIFDIGIFDPVAGDFVEVFLGNTSPASGVFHTQGTCFPVVAQFAGTGNYTLTLAVEAAADPIVERESNNVSGEGQYLGTIDAGQQVRVSGSANSGPDANDKFLLVVPEDIDLAASLAFPVAGDFDVVYADATPDLLAPVEFARFESPTNNPEVGTAPVSALTIVEVTVFAFAGSGNYTLTLNATAADDFGDGPRPWRMASTSNELRQRFARLSGPRFATPVFESMPGELLVMPRAGRDMAAELARRGLRVEMQTPDGVLKCVEPVPEGASDELSRRRTLALVASLSTCDSVEYVEPNFICRPYFDQTPNDTFFNLQWHYAQIQLPAAWDITLGDDAVRVGVIDTGETAHPDLAGRQIPGFDFISSATVGGDFNGVDSDPTDVGDGVGSQPSSFHGTHVAGTIGAATDNNLGVAGVTWFGKVMHLRVLGKGGGSVLDISQAVRYSAGLSSTNPTPLAQPLDVINMSLGGPGDSVTFRAACTAAHNAGVVIFAAAGNENSTQPSFPAAFDDVISVAAVDFNAARAPYSNRHPTVDLAAPGGDMTRDLNGDGFSDGVLSTRRDDSVNPAAFVFEFQQGTSMASPHAAGVAALIIAARKAIVPPEPPLTPAEIESIMTGTATDLGVAGHDTSFGFGLVNAFQAVLAASTVGPPIPTPPVLGLSTQSLSFGPGATSINVLVTNVGGGVLLVGNPVAATTPPFNGWLAANRVAIGVPVSSDTSAIAITVDRTGLADGTYTGSVTVPSNGSDGAGGSLVIQVFLQVGGAPPAENVDIFVVAVDSTTGDGVRQDIVNPTGTLAYAVATLPAGSYFIVAGSDDDDDGFICGPGDRFCGAFPTLSQLVEITVGSGEALPAIDFAVEISFQGASAGTGVPPRGFRIR